MTRSRTDLVAAGLIGAGSLALLAGTFDPAYDQAGAGAASDPVFYPRLLLVGSLLIALALAVGGLLRPGGAGMPPQHWRRLAGSAALTGLYAWLVVEIGFLIATLPFCIMLPIVLDFRRPVALLAFAAGTALTVWFVFVFLLEIRLPTSPWFDHF